MTATTGCFAWEVTSNKWPLLFSFQSYDSNEYERGSFVHTGCYLHLNTSRVWMYVRVSVGLKGGKSVLAAWTNTAALLLIISFLYSGTKYQGHVIKVNISSFTIYIPVHMSICIYVWMDIYLLDGLQALYEISWMADRSIQIFAVLWPLVRQNTVSLVVWTKQRYF